LVLLWLVDARSEKLFCQATATVHVGL